MAEAEGKKEDLSVSQLMEDLAGVSDWFLLGSSLGLETSQLDVIERDVPAGTGATNQRKSRVLDTWIKGKTGDPSWRDVVAALIKMGQNNVAEKMRMKYSGSMAVPLDQLEQADALVIAKANEHKLRGLFAQLIQLVSTKLQALPIDMEMFTSFVKHYFSCADCIPTPGNIDNIFLAIERNEFWDYVNYSPLQKIAEVFGGDDPELQQAFKEYRGALAGYLVSTKVVHYFATRSQFSEEAYYSDTEQTVARRDQRYFVKLSLKLKAKATEKSLQYLTELWEGMSEYLLLPALSYLLDEIISGSIVAIWLVPRSIIPTLIIRCKQPSAAKFFAGYDICSITIDDMVVYEEKVEDSSTKQSSDVQEKVEKEDTPNIATDTTQLDSSIKQSLDTQKPAEERPSPDIASEIVQLDSSSKHSPDTQKQVEKEFSLDSASDAAQLEHIQDASSKEHEKEEDEWCESQLELFQDIVSREKKIRKRIEEEIDELRSTNAYNEVKIGQLEEELTKLEVLLNQTREEQQQTTEASAVKEEEIAQLRDELSQAREQAEQHIKEKEEEIEKITSWSIKHLDAAKEQLCFRDSITRRHIEESETLRRAREQEEIQSPSAPIRPSELHPGVRLQWRRCVDTPVGMDRAQAIVVGENVYVGGGGTDTEANKYLVFQYNRRGDTWSTLPRCPVSRFGMAHFMGRIITVGGVDLHDYATGTVYSLKEESQQWEEFITPMPTARGGLSVATTSVTIVAAGSKTGYETFSSAVEVYSSDTSQWHTADPLPVPCAWISSVTIDNICYLLGGRDQYALTDCWCASLPLLVHGAVSPNPRSISRPVWNYLPPTPLYNSTAACLSRSLVAVGGRNDDETQSSAVYGFINSSWVRLNNGDLPSPRSLCTTAQLSAVEVIVIGGWDEQNRRSKTVFIGTLHSQ